MSGTAAAIPELQLYIEGASYDSVSETWVLSANPLTLWVVGNITGSGSKGTISNVILYAAFSDTVVSPVISLVGTMAGLSGWTDPSTPASPTAGTRDTSGSTPTGLSPHGIYGASTDWIPFPLGTMSLSDSPIADISPLCDPATSSTGPACSAVAAKGQINAYTITSSGFPAGALVHFDVTGVITKNNGDTSTINAPFSHDAEDPPQLVPEPTSLLLLGSGLMGLGFFGWKRKR